MKVGDKTFVRPVSGLMAQIFVSQSGIPDYQVAFSETNRIGLLIEVGRHTGIAMKVLFYYRGRIYEDHV